jgi:uncharacterized membrane protein
MSELAQTLTIIAALGSGLVAGFFFSFSFVIMGSLERVPAAQAMVTMQTINVVVLNAWFFAAFFGTALICLALAVLAFMPWSSDSITLLLGCALYLIGTIFVTMRFNVPLNNALAKADPASDDGVVLWARYLKVWTAWNHMRTAAPLAACACFILALL